jgi:hypothetical protein
MILENWEDREGVSTEELENSCFLNVLISDEKKRLGYD